jgi:hypothetical protein
MYNPLIGGPPVSPGDNLGNNDYRRQPNIMMDDNSFAVSVDGTPMRVVALALSAAASLAMLRWAGFRFNVGVSS